MINVSGDHLGLGGIDTLEQLAEVKRIIVEVATDTAVLNADDELCLKMADYTTAKHLCYVTMNPRHPLVREHIRAGARAVVLEEGLNGQQIVLYDNGRHIPLLWTHLIPATMEAGRCTTCRTPWSPPPSPTAWARSSRTSATGCAPSTPRSSRRPAG